MEHDGLTVGVRMAQSPPTGAVRDAARRFIDIGARGLWWADHLRGFHPPAMVGAAEEPWRAHAYADPFLCMAALADLPGSPLLGVAVTDAIRRMPATLVQTVMTIDHLAPGRGVLGLGAGEAVNHRPFGWDVESPAERFASASREMRRLLDDPGPYADGSVMGLRPPPGSAGPQLWLAAHGGQGLELVGEVADGWLPTQLTVEAWHAGAAALRAAAASHGRPDGAIVLGLSINVLLADDHERAHEELDHPANRVLALLAPPSTFERHGARHPLGRSTMFRQFLDDDRVTAAAEAVPPAVVHDLLPHGTPEEVADRLVEYQGLGHLRLSDVGGRGARRGIGDTRLLEALVGRLTGAT
ncbi:MAG: phthiodiolone/phenolphthiodiolone dimycocerosates ketoreductase [Acidimicrobiaceae bacterium]|nr:phthiodiolone/phenolphthiodiolone dimycocerosates ketoreductase [Acidimicrobiaceae bacterium]